MVHPRLLLAIAFFSEYRSYPIMILDFHKSALEVTLANRSSDNVQKHHAPNTLDQIDRTLDFWLVKYGVGEKLGNSDRKASGQLDEDYKRQHPH